MAQKLDQLRDKLYKAFENAEYLYDHASEAGGNYIERQRLKAEALTAMGQTAQGISSIEHEIAVQKAYEDWKASGANIDDDIAGGIIRDVRTMAKLKIKPAEPK